MYKLFFYFLLCSLLNPVRAQDSSRIQPPQSQINQVKKPVAKKGAAADSCCKTIEQLRHDLAKLDPKEFKKKYKDKPARETIQALDLLINRIISREDSYKLHLMELGKEVRAEAGKELSAPAVRLMIIDRSSGADIPLQGTVVFDPAVDPVPYLEKIKGGGQPLNARLLSGANGLLLKFNEPDIPVLSQTDLSPAPAQQEKKESLLLPLLSGLFLLFGIAAYWRSRSLLKQARAAGNQGSPLIADLSAAPAQQAADPVEERSAIAPEPSERYLPGDGGMQPASTPFLHVSMPAVVPAPRSHFFAEIMTTAGPRKKYVSEPDADKDLGEDVCGFVADDKELLLYLLDGTSDLHCLRNPETGQEYFSSRLLAQSLANQLRLAFTASQREEIETVITGAIRTVKEDWLRIINSLPAQEKGRIKTSIENKSFPECATTLLISRLSVNGKMTVYRSGDSKMLLFSSPDNGKLRFEDTPLVQKNEHSNDRVFFRLVLSPGNELDILHNKPQYEVIEKEKIQTAIAFSDGIGTLTEQLLQQRYALNADEIRKEIFYQIQGTADDKAICFITIRP